MIQRNSFLGKFFLDFGSELSSCFKREKREMDSSSFASCLQVFFQRRQEGVGLGRKKGGVISFFDFGGKLVNPVKFYSCKCNQRKIKPTSKTELKKAPVSESGKNSRNYLKRFFKSNAEVNSKILLIGSKFHIQGQKKQGIKFPIKISFKQLNNIHISSSEKAFTSFPVRNRPLFSQTPSIALVTNSPLRASVNKQSKLLLLDNRGTSTFEPIRSKKTLGKRETNFILKKFEQPLQQAIHRLINESRPFTPTSSAESEKNSAFREFVKSHYEPLKEVVRFYAEVSKEDSVRVLLNNRLGVANLLFLSTSQSEGSHLNLSIFQNLASTLSNLGFSNVSIAYATYSGEKRHNSSNYSSRENKSLKSVNKEPEENLQMLTVLVDVRI